MFGTTIAIALDMFYTCVCISYFLQRTFYDERRNSLCLLSHKFCPSLYPPLDGRGKKIKPLETPVVSQEELGITTRGRDVHGVLGISNILLSLCGHDLTPSVLGQGKGYMCGQN